MIIVSGCPRSGTSLMMDIMRTALGDKRILGAKFPRQERLKLEKGKKEIKEKLPEISKYMLKKKKAAGKGQKQRKERSPESVRDMNPKGFWECKYTVKGATYTPGDSDLESNKVVKIVSQGLFNTDPRYVDKIVFMLRCPRQVAKSQEKLGGRRQFPKEFGEIHSPEMFVRVTKQAAEWLIVNPGVEILIVNYDELLSDPVTIGKQLREFVGEGDFNEAIKVIDPTLKRSKPEDIDHELWPIADAIFDKMKVKDYQGVTDLKLDRPLNYICARTERQTSLERCRLCSSNETVRENFKKHAKTKGIDWKNEPCVHECLNGMSVKKSIKNNSWNTGRDDEKELQYQKEVLARMKERKVALCELKRQRKYIRALENE